MKPKKKSVRLWAVVFWLLVWQGASMALAVLYPHGALLLASPLSALARLGELAVTAAFWRTALTSAARILGGFLLACALAVVLAALAVRYRRVEELLAPLVSVVKAVPVASFIILALVWLESRHLPLFIAALMAFAARAQEELCDPDVEKNPWYRYAACRHILLRKGRAVELMVAYEPAYAMMAEWWKQLYGESEGKDGKGLFPASVIFSTDLHSLGQFVQDGANILFETVVLIDKAQKELTIKEDPENVDGLNFLTGRTMATINQKAFEGTVLAHADGGTPSLVLHLPQATEENLGYLIYFFEKACAVSGYMLGVNPFDQPGVEGYKKNMFALLAKPGYEDEKAALEKRLGY